jgi:uncharacterized membrane protein YeiB
MKASASTREEGYDLARALAIVLMVLVNFQLMLARPPAGEGTAELLLRWLVHVPSGRSSSLFVVLSGAGFSLLTRRARESGDRVELRVARRTLLLRAAFLFVLGNLLHVVWSIDILHFYACYLAIAALLFLRASDAVLLGAAALITALGAALEVLLEVLAPDREELPFLSPGGMALDALIDGVHPVVPWLAFVAYGAWLGRRDLAHEGTRRALLRRAALVVVAVELGSLAVSYAATRLDALAALRPHLGLLATSWTPDPLYVVSASATATVMITLAHEVVARPAVARQPIVRALVATGQLALSLYLTHAIVGVVIPRWTLGIGHALSVTVVTAYWAGFVLVAIAGAALHRRFFARGPLEWVMRRLTSFRLSSEPSRELLRQPLVTIAHAPAPRSAGLAWAVVAVGGLALAVARLTGLPLAATTGPALEVPTPAPLFAAGELTLLGMRAEHRLDVRAPTHVILETRSGADLYLELDGVGPDGTRTRLGEDDDGGDGLDARLELDLAPGEHRVIVRPYAATTGPFLLEVRAGD